MTRLCVTRRRRVTRRWVTSVRPSASCQGHETCRHEKARQELRAGSPSAVLQISVPERSHSPGRRRSGCEPVEFPQHGSARILGNLPRFDMRLSRISTLAASGALTRLLRRERQPPGAEGSRDRTPAVRERRPARWRSCARLRSTAGVGPAPGARVSGVPGSRSHACSRSVLAAGRHPVHDRRCCARSPPWRASRDDFAYFATGTTAALPKVSNGR